MAMASFSLYIGPVIKRKNPFIDKI